MPDQEDILRYERRLMRRIINQDSKVQEIFNGFISKTAPSLARYKEVRPGKIWYRNSSIEKAIEKELVALQGELHSYLLSEEAAAWRLANTKTNRMVSNYVKGMSISNVVRDGLFSRNLESLQAFQQRKVGNLDPSGRIWKAVEQTKENLEFYLQSGISEGRSAATVSQDVRNLLNNPDARFRRIRDPRTGKLKPSRPMAAYHPGQGVYRSAFKNALRMIRTETNAAYRISDQVRWQQLEFVTGYEIRLSNAHPVVDICDSMTGLYPKGFIFDGWHPQCFCYMVPANLPAEQFVAHLKGKAIPDSAYVSTLPQRAKSYIRSNSAKLKKYTTKPNWLKVNFDYKNGRYIPVNAGKLTTEKLTV